MRKKREAQQKKEVKTKVFLQISKKRSLAVDEGMWREEKAWNKHFSERGNYFQSFSFVEEKVRGQLW